MPEQDLTSNKGRLSLLGFAQEGFFMAERLQTPTLEKQEEIRAYDWGLDRKKWLEISAQEGQIPPAEYAQTVLDFQRETLINLETNLGERFNAQLFEVYYPLENGRMMHPRQNVPFLDSLVEGQQHRLGQDTNLNRNQKRELAEVISFSAVESYFTENSQSDKTFINSSPPSGDYGGNFIDVFDSQQKKGQTCVRLRRFAVSATLKDHWEIAQVLTENQLASNNPQDEIDIKIKSVAIKTSKTTDEILDLYLPDQTALNLEDYQELKNKYQPFAREYINAVMSGKSIVELEQIHNAGLKYADIQMGKDIDSTGTVTSTPTGNPQKIPFIINVLGSQDLRPVATGCGIQGNLNSGYVDLTYTSLFNINSFDYSKSSKDKSDFRCPGKKKNGSPCTFTIKYGSGIRTCPKCGEEAKCPA